MFRFLNSPVSQTIQEVVPEGSPPEHRQGACSKRPQSDLGQDGAFCDSEESMDSKDEPQNSSGLMGSEICGINDDINSIVRPNMGVEAYDFITTPHS